MDKNNHENVYGAVVVAQSHCESSLGYVMNMEQYRAAADPQTGPNDLGCESACRLPEATPTIAIYYC